MLSNPTSTISRRAFLRGALVATGGAALAAGYADMGIDSSAGRILEEIVRIEIPDLPPAFHGYRIGFFTDVHLGIWVPDDWVADGLDRLKRHNPDILVLGGDYILANDNPLWPAMGWIRNPRYAAMDAEDLPPFLFAQSAKILSSFSPPDGIIAVVGNHERWNSVESFFEAFRSYPQIRVLVNDEVEVRRGEQSLHFFGADDYLTGVPARLPSAQRQGGRQSRVVVSHNPDYVSALLRDGASPFSFAMCGHTHGGQVNLPGVTTLAAPVNDKRFISGLVRVGGKQIYTSRGLGVVGVPFRFNCPPEVTIFELTRA